MPDIVGYKTYTTKWGDAFDSIALKEYAEETYANYIIDANPDYCDVLIFEESVELQIPVLETKEVPETLPPWRRSS